MLSDPCKAARQVQDEQCKSIHLLLISVLSGAWGTKASESTDGVNGKKVAFSYIIGLYGFASLY